MDITYLDNISEQKIIKNPKKIGYELTELSEQLNRHRDNIEELKNRSILKRIFSNNTKDLADNILSQSEIMSGFMDFIKRITFLCMNNIAALTQIYESMEEQGQVVDEFGTTLENQGNTYYNMAKQYVGEALESAKRTKITEEEIEKINEHIKSIYLHHEGQSSRLEEIEIQLKQQEKSYYKKVKIMDSSLSELSLSVSDLHTYLDNAIDDITLLKVKLKACTLWIYALGAGLVVSIIIGILK